MHLGTNGTFTDASFDELLAAAGDDTPVLVVSVRAPRPWEAEVNAALARGVERHRHRAVLVDWHATATADDLCRDGFHLTRRGAATYAETIAAAVRAGPAAAGMLTR